MSKPYYQNRILKIREEHSKVKRQSNILVMLRAITFLSVCGSLWYYFSEDSVGGIILALIGMIFFIMAMNRHRKTQAIIAKLTYLADWNEKEIDRSELRLKGLDSGAEFLQKNHPYQSDLDLLGEHSLFQLINRCVLQGSKQILANWLSNPSGRKEILARQGATKEFSSIIDWCQEFSSAIALRYFERKKNQPQTTSENVINWAEGTLPKININLLKILVFDLIGLSVAVGAGILFFDLPYQLIYLNIFVNGILLLFVNKRLQKLTGGISEASYFIESYLAAIVAIENLKVTSPRLQLLQTALSQDIKASAAIKTLAKILHRLDGRSNMLYFLINIFLLLDPFLYMRLHTWKKQHGKRIQAWFDIIHETECLVSIGSFAFANANQPYPEISQEESTFEAFALKHPLIQPEEAVANDYQLSGKGNIDIITGSNMSGKSTFLRTLGINMVLANIGAPVFAKSLKLSPFSLFTSMRTTDALEESTSSFYAELKRLKQLLSMLNDDTPTFFLLDEILKGTNSKDRHEGAVALSQKLSEQNALGLISTHDLGLGEWAATQEGFRNYSFNSQINAEEIIFDYKLTNGACKSFNASQLMKNIGIIPK